MENDVEIRWTNSGGGHGCMVIHQDYFFPAKKSLLKQLLKKVVALDYEHQDDIIKEMESFCIRSIPELEDLRKQRAKDYVDSRQKVADLTPVVEAAEKEIQKIQDAKQFVTKKKKSELNKLLKQKKLNLKTLKSELSGWKHEVQKSLSDTKKILQRIELFKKDIEILQQRK